MATATDNSNPTRQDIIDLREQGKTREQIAEHYDVSVTTVRQWIKAMDIPRPSKQARHRRETHLSRDGGIIIPVGDDRTTMEKAEEALGDRLTEKRGMGYFLDGRPASIYKIMEAAGIDIK